MKKIKLMIAEDMQIFRDVLLRDVPNDLVSIIGAAENGAVLLELIKVELPDIVLLDIIMPVLGGIDTLKILSKDYPTIKVIILSNEYSDFYVANCIITGAAAYLTKYVGMEEISKAIFKVHEDGFYFNEIVSKDILEQLKNDKKLYYLLDNQKFSEREIEVLRELCKDISPKQIAANLNISENTLRYHKNNLLKKTESESIISLVKYAIKQGISN